MPHGSFTLFLGLESLIAKDWIALGHPFAQRLLGIPNGDNEAVIAPTFLLFLDCLAQLIRLYPMQFAYSQHVLIALWDLSITGMVPAFTSSSVADQLGMQRCGGPFPIERFFNDSYTHLFANITNMAAVAVQNATEAMLIEDIIRPPRSIINVQLWSECYLRWIPPANVRVSSAYPYSEADVSTRGYYSKRADSDTISISSMTLSTSSNLPTLDDKMKHRSSVPVLGGIPEGERGGHTHTNHVILESELCLLLCYFAQLFFSETVLSVFYTLQTIALTSTGCLISFENPCDGSYMKMVAMYVVQLI
ncbi:hypothetical protein ANCCAN_27002 [Ancylostoma caninum]|uniref:Myotubularin phosphatase domain-containing protein n=1 Tax=Ancylostoma caninum TaxID=29170 RepID=A0A368F8R7_ANCCA|nr:hypothetical protein ANCCAN_27002 [Ancylostoma caninum]